MFEFQRLIFCLRSATSPIVSFQQYAVSIVLPSTIQPPGNRIKDGCRSSNNLEIASDTISGITKEWQKYEVILKVTEGAKKAKLVLSLEENGTVDADMVSLFPTDTYVLDNPAETPVVFSIRT